MNFEDMAYLFNCDLANRRLIRQNFDEAALLWKAVKRSRGDILEIGRYNGGGTILICAAAKERKVFSIDKNAPPSILKTLSNLTLITGDSKSVILNEKFGFIFIDGDHTYEGVRKDTQRFWPSLEIGGLILYHDAIEPSSCPGVSKVCCEQIDSGFARQREHAGSSLLLEKIK